MSASPEQKATEVFPELFPDAATEDELKRDTRLNSGTRGLIVVQNQLRVVFSDDVTVEEINTALKAIGARIISSGKGVTVVTLEIPDTGDLSAVDRAEEILSSYPFVVATVPVIIDEVPQSLIDKLPKPTNLSLVYPELLPL